MLTVKEMQLTGVRHFNDRHALWERQVQRPSFPGANISSAGAHNRKVVLHTIRVGQDISRTEIANVTGLTRPAIFGIARDLLDEGLVTVHRTSAKLKGQPVHNLRLNPNVAFGLGLDIGQDHLTLVAIDFVGEIRFRHHLPARFASPTEIRRFVSDGLLQIQSQNLVPMSKVTGIGVAISDIPGRGVSNAVNIPELLRDLLDLRIRQESDAASAAIGEMSFGRGLNLESFFYVFIGAAGLGGGLVIDRRYVRGAHGRSGEIGFLPQLNPLRSSQTNFQKTLGDAVLISDLLDDFRSLGFKSVSIETIERLSGADAIIQRWVARVADYLYLPLLTVMATIDPEAILIGGQLPPSVNEALCVQISKRLSMHVGMAWPEMAVRPAAVGRDSAAVGAAFLAFQEKWNGDNMVETPVGETSGLSRMRGSPWRR